MVLKVHRNHKAYQLKTANSVGRGGGMKVGKEGDYIHVLLCHPPSDSCIKVDSDGRQFNVSLIVRDRLFEAVAF